ncbi:hypothetical protein [Tranquillimonas rosea]|uniref:hypothetical protein n=1 Tax=Tranquillimonas rosea TaxID=641238 RepID=UPI003BABB3B3
MSCQPDDIARLDDGWIEAQDLPRRERYRIPPAALAIGAVTVLLTLIAVAAAYAERIAG